MMNIEELAKRIFVIRNELDILNINIYKLKQQREELEAEMIRLTKIQDLD